MSTLSRLQSAHPQFHYQSFTWKHHQQTLALEFGYLIEPDIPFNHSLTFSPVPPPKKTQVLDQLVFHLGLVELLSYWKLTCSPRIIIRAGSLSPTQLDWWHRFYIRSMGEYFYQNRIDFTQPKFLTLTSPTAKKTAPPGSIPKTHQILLPIGGGKDSIVSLELLKTLKPTLFAINPTPAIHQVFHLHPTLPRQTVLRRLDPSLLKLNRQGFLNGHIPFSSVIAFAGLIAAYCLQYNYIATSNESSANEPNTVFHGRTINHQYSKSFDFESKFASYVKKYLVKNIAYFSLLRPFNELQIAQRFSQYPQYFPLFLSCNRGQRTNDWCGTCPKCVSTYLSLAPFIPPNTLQQIFKKPVLTRQNLPLLLDLIDPRTPKPFECVASYQESQAALNHLLDHHPDTFSAPVAAKLRHKLHAAIPPVTDLTRQLNHQHRLPPRFLKYVQPA